VFPRKRFVLLILSVTCIIASAEAATLHGTIYGWSDFEEPLKNTIVGVNSTPSQYMVATTGTYSFNLSPGSYLIKAKYYRNNILEYAAEEEIRIDREGNFVHDLLLFPPTDIESEYLGDINLTGMDIKSEYNLNYYIIILILVFSGLIIVYWIKKKKNKAGEPASSISAVPASETVVETKSKELPEDLRDIYGLILKRGGRVTQKDLRKEMKYSEAKVSLMLDDLEDRGFVKKIKKGRSNIIIAQVQK
jgi:uncharacterized membrane protein